MFRAQNGGGGGPGKVDGGLVRREKNNVEKILSPGMWCGGGGFPKRKTRGTQGGGFGKKKKKKEKRLTERKERPAGVGSAQGEEGGDGGKRGPRGTKKKSKKTRCPFLREKWNSGGDIIKKEDGRHTTVRQ